VSRVGSPQIRAVVGAEAVSSVGSAMTVLALPWFVLVTTGSATKLRLVLGIGSIPFVTLPLPAGSLIARIGARQTMVIADAARLPLLAAIPALYSLDALSFPLLVVLVALTNACLAAHMPAQRLVLAEVVGDEESLVARVNAYLDGAQTAAPLVGPALAGVLIAALGASNVLYVHAATFGVAALVVALFVPRREPMTEAEERGLLTGAPEVPARDSSTRGRGRRCAGPAGALRTADGSPIFTVITTRTPAAVRNLVLPAAFGLMFLTGPLGPIAAGPLINAVGTRMVFVIAAAGCLVGSAPFAVYVARNRSLGDRAR
jgi:MFS family permease